MVSDVLPNDRRRLLFVNFVMASLFSRRNSNRKSGRGVGGLDKGWTETHLHTYLCLIDVILIYGP